MAKVGVFETEVYLTKDRKKLKSGSKTYEYGTINLRDPRLTEYIGKQVKVKIETLENK